MTFICLEPGFISSHKHPEEQVGYILSGEMELVIGEERMDCYGGDGYLIPSETPHSFRVISKQPVELLEIFSPPKEENKI
jgi:mannose-6-phosphate isomerase-like protein (cupin superfamily)